MNKKSIILGICIVFLVFLIDYIALIMRWEYSDKHYNYKTNLYSVSGHLSCLIGGGNYEIVTAERCCFCASSDYYGKYMCNPKPENYERDCPTG